MIWPVHIRRVSVWMVALALLMFMFSLSACAGNVANQGAPAVQTTEGTQPQQATPSSTTAPQSVSSTTQSPVQSGTDTTTPLQNTDQQIQKTLQSLDNAQNDVNTSSAVQENEQQP
jgi:hypothetical protein